LGGGTPSFGSACFDLSRMSRGFAAKQIAMKKKPASRARLAEIAQKIEEQRRRAVRPTLPVNTHAQVSKSRKEQERAIDRRKRQRREWESE
jgi:hypothetical protein